MFWLMFDHYKIFFFLFGKSYKHVAGIFDTCSKKVKEKYFDTCSKRVKEKYLSDQSRVFLTTSNRD